MGRIVVSEFISVDGVMEDPGGAEHYRHGGWAFQFERGRAGDQFKLDELTSAQAMLLGRVTYEGLAAAWPTRHDEVGFADKMNGMPKYVISRTLRDPAWNNSTVLSGDPLDEIRALTDRITGDILVAGSGRLVQLLSEQDLVDEYRLMIFPVLLGSGKRLFGETERSSPRRLQVASHDQSGDVDLLVLRRAE